MNDKPEIKPVVSADGFMLDVKRCALPFIAAATCPKCGSRVERNFAEDDYVSYPVLGRPTRLYFYHECPNGDDSGWPIEVVINFTMELVP